ncbi:hypothetical protein D3C71_1307890 [compost metagenome]
MISICAVDVSTPQLRRCSMASSRFQLVLGISSSRAWSTAARATSALAAGLPPGSVAVMVTWALPRTA